MVKRFLVAFVVTTLITGGYFYLTKNEGVQMANAKQMGTIETAAGSAEEPNANVDFTLTDQNGKKVTNKDLQGKKLLVFFGFTSCPDTCPVSMAVMTEVMNQLESQKVIGVLPVFISIDPKHDTPAELKTFLKDYYPGFIALTGEQSEIDKLTKSYKVYAQTPAPAAAEQDDAPNHSNLIYYMGTDGKYIAHFTGENAPEDIVDYVSNH